jgi:hypothetical protein
MMAMDNLSVERARRACGWSALAAIVRRFIIRATAHKVTHYALSLRRGERGKLAVRDAYLMALPALDIDGPIRDGAVTVKHWADGAHESPPASM